MFVLKSKYNRLVDTKNYWEEAYRESQSKVVMLEEQCNRLYKKHNKADDEVFKGGKKEMTKYAKITKYDGFEETDRRNGLEIGKTYEIVSFDNSYNNDCYIYLNHEEPHYFITDEQYELVEKEYPVATFKVDVKEVIQAKIDEIRRDAEIIANKRNRLERQIFNLNSKANTLEEVIETIKEFE